MIQWFKKKLELKRRKKIFAKFRIENSDLLAEWNQKHPYELPPVFFDPNSDSYYWMPRDQYRKIKKQLRTQK